MAKIAEVSASAEMLTFVRKVQRYARKNGYPLVERLDVERERYLAVVEDLRAEADRRNGGSGELMEQVEPPKYIIVDGVMITPIPHRSSKARQRDPLGWKQELEEFKRGNVSAMVIRGDGG